jgi:hypothetical protein
MPSRVAQRAQRSQNFRIAHFGFRPAAEVAIEGGSDFILARKDGFDKAIQLSPSLGGIRIGISKVSRALPEERALQSGSVG